jgi:hypothetical protein
MKKVCKRVAKFAARLGLSGSSHPACEKKEPPIGSHGPVQNTGPRSKPDGERTLRLIERRCLRKMGNTDRVTMANYRRVHSVLSRGG